VAGGYNFVISAGADFADQLTLKQNGSVIDITGYTAQMQIRATTEATTTLADYSTDNGKLAINGPLGTITFAVSDTETAGYTFERGVYDLVLTSAGGVKSRILMGSVQVSPDVTR